MSSQQERGGLRGGGGEKLIAVGKLLRPHGLKGEMKLKPFIIGAIEELAGKTVTVEPESGISPLSIKLVKVRGAHTRLIVRLRGIDTPERAKEITPAIVKIARGDMPKPAGGYYPEELLGLAVFDTKGDRLGEISDVFPAGERDAWTIRRDGGGEMMIPAIPDVVKSVDLAAGRAVIEPMEETEA